MVVCSKCEINDGLLFGKCYDCKYNKYKPVEQKPTLTLKKTDVFLYECLRCGALQSLIYDPQHEPNPHRR